MSDLEEATWRYVDKTCSHLDAAERSKVVAKVLKAMKRTLAAVSRPDRPAVRNTEGNRKSKQ